MKRCALLILPLAAYCAHAATVRKTDVLTAAPACWKRVELRLDVAASFQSAFDPDEIRVDATFRAPSGRVFTVPAFLYQAFEREVRGKTDEGQSEERLHPAGKPEWRVRFLPQEPGRYTVTIAARDREGESRAQPVSFSVSPAVGHGFIRVSRRDPRYFAFDDGTPYFALGENMAGGPTAEFYRWITRLSAAGGNYGRLWIGNNNFGLERGRMGEYRLDNAWRLDQVIELSEQMGVYQKMCLESIRNITPKGEPRKNFDPEDFAYSVSNGGPCRDMLDFFVLDEAKRRFRARLRYTVARWGYSPAVMAWELWNEYETVGVKKPKEEILVPWSIEMCRYLKSVDPWRHLTTNSLGSHALIPELWQSPEHDFAQMHGYYGWHKPEDEELARDMSALMVKWLDKLTAFRKPYLWAEFGVARGRTPELRELGDRDQNGVHMHAGLWTPVMHGAAGAGAMWWWGAYVDRKDLYYHFHGLANFVKGIPWTTAAFRKLEAEPENPGLIVLGQRGAGLAIAWVRNRGYTWWRVIHNEPTPPVESTYLRLRGMARGKWRVEYWDAYSGLVTGTKTVNDPSRIPLPPIERDIALKMIRLEQN